MELVLRGFQDLRKVLQPVNEVHGEASPSKPKRAGGGSGGLRKGPGSSPMAAAIPFPEAWQAYCSQNPRLRDPRALPTLVRRGVPDDLRREVWSHCLGIEWDASLGTTGPSRTVAETSAAAEPGVAHVADALEVGDAAATGWKGCDGPDVAQQSSEEANSAVEAKGSSPAGGHNCASTSSRSLGDAACTSTEEQEIQSASVGKAAATSSLAEEGAQHPAVASAVDAGHKEDAPGELQDTAPEAEAAAERRACGAADDGLAGSLPHGLAELIEADVLRTFPNCAEFLELDGHNRLRRALRRMAAADTELGYCQSMNFITAIFIMVLYDENAAMSAVRNLFVKLGTRCWYTDGMKQLRADTAVLEDLLRERLPAVHGALRAHKFDLIFVSSKWFLCLFATSLEGEALRRVWDVMLSDGIEAVFRVAFAMLAHCSNAILKAPSHDDLIFMFQDWKLSSSPEELISAAYDASLIGSISRADLAQRRRQAAARVSSADTRAEMRNLQFLRGGVRPASVLAR